MELKHIIVEILNYQQLEKVQEVLNIRQNETLEEEEKVFCNNDYTHYQSKNNCSKVTVDNIQRNLSSFFSWLEDEDHIIATKAIDKGMPIEQEQKLLGHQQIDTTMHYAMVN